MSIQIFISYKHHEIDSKIAQELYEKLQEWGYNPWMDVHSIPKGIGKESNGWVDSIHKGLLSSQILIGLISPESLISKNVQDEWVWAKEQGLYIFLIKVRDFETKYLAPPFIQALRINYTEGLSDLKSALLPYTKLDFSLFLEELNDKNEDTRLNVINRISELGDKRAIEVLMLKLDDESQFIQEKIIDVLIKLGAIDRLLSRLNSDNTQIHKIIIHRLSINKNENIVETLINKLNDGDFGFANANIKLLGDIKSRRSVIPLLNLLDKTVKNQHLKSWIINITLIDTIVLALGKTGDKQCVAPLISILDYQVNNPRWDGIDNIPSIIKALGLLGDRYATNKLLSLLDSDYSSYAIEALGDLGDIRAIEPLFNLMSRQNKHHDTITLALGKLGDKRVIDMIIDLLSSEEIPRTKRYQNEIIITLDKINDDRIITPLMNLLWDDWLDKVDNSHLYNSIENALVNRGYFSVNPLIDALINRERVKTLEKAQNLQKVCCKILSRIGLDSIEPVIYLYKNRNGDEGLKLFVDVILGGITDIRATDYLINLLGEEDIFLLRVIISALGNIRNPQSIKPLIELYKSSVEDSVKDVIIYSIKKIGTLEAKKALLDLGF